MIKKTKKLNHSDYLEYTLPINWCAEEEEDELCIYDPDGNGAITISFYNRMDREETLVKFVTNFASRFMDQNEIALEGCIQVLVRKEKTVLQAVGKASDGYFCKIWVVAKDPKIVLATYFSESKSKEVKTCDSIMDSFQFTF